jgi:hypothetical protein
MLFQGQRNTPFSQMGDAGWAHNSLSTEVMDFERE